LDYESRRDVAINILRDTFIQRTSEHYADVASERRRKHTEVEEIYKRPQVQGLVRELGRDLEAQNRIRRLFRWLVFTSHTSFGCIWSSVIIVLIGVTSIWLEPTFALAVIWCVLLALSLLGFVVSVSVMWVLDSRFFSMVHNIIEPEGE